ncbi:MAG: hypothetical protein WBP26_05305 [Candidatus Saccharimonadales bacterium]
MIFHEKPTIEQVTALTGDFNTHFFHTIVRRTLLEKHIFDFEGQLVAGVKDPFLLNDVHTVADHHIDTLPYSDRDDTADRRDFCRAMLGQYIGASEGVFLDWSEKKNTTWCHRNREYMTVSLRALFGGVESVDRLRILARNSIELTMKSRAR